MATLKTTTEYGTYLDAAGEPVINLDEMRELLVEHKADGPMDAITHYLTILIEQPSALTDDAVKRIVRDVIIEIPRYHRDLVARYEAIRARRPQLAIGGA